MSAAHKRHSRKNPAAKWLHALAACFALIIVQSRYNVNASNWGALGIALVIYIVTAFVFAIFMARLSEENK